MSKNVNEVAVKGRQTKLAKKTYEELIQIILRKDKTERLNASTIKNLKAEVNDIKLANEQLNKVVKEKLTENGVLKHNLDNANKRCKELSSMVESKDNDLFDIKCILKESILKINTYKGVCLFLCVALVISIIANILL